MFWGFQVLQKKKNHAKSCLIQKKEKISIILIYIYIYIYLVVDSVQKLFLMHTNLLILFCFLQWKDAVGSMSTYKLLKSLSMLLAQLIYLLMYMTVSLLCLENAFLYLKRDSSSSECNRKFFLWDVRVFLPICYTNTFR